MVVMIEYAICRCKWWKWNRNVEKSDKEFVKLFLHESLHIAKGYNYKLKYFSTIYGSEENQLATSQWKAWLYRIENKMTKGWKAILDVR